MWSQRYDTVFLRHRPRLVWSAYARYRLGAAEPSPLELLRQRWVDARYTARMRMARESHPHAVPEPPISIQAEESTMYGDLSGYMPVNPDGVRVADWDFPDSILSMSLDDTERPAPEGETYAEDEEGLPWYRDALRSIMGRQGGTDSP